MEENLHFNSSDSSQRLDLSTIVVTDTKTLLEYRALSGNEKTEDRRLAVSPAYRYIARHSIRKTSGLKQLFYFFLSDLQRCDCN